MVEKWVFTQARRCSQPPLCRSVGRFYEIRLSGLHSTSRSAAVPELDVRRLCLSRNSQTLNDPTPHEIHPWPLPHCCRITNRVRRRPARRRKSSSGQLTDSRSSELTIAVGSVILSGSPVFTKPLPPRHVPGAKVYAPHILTHFIACTRGGCYNSIYQNFVVPCFDSAAVLDYVLRTPVVHGDTVLEDGIPAPKMYPELLSRLRGIRSQKIQQYFAQRFGS